MIELDQIYNEDCLEGMKRIPDASVDCIITDLPYGTTRNPWDSIIPLDKLWTEYKRIIMERGAIVLFSQQPFTSTLVASNPQMFKYEWIWEKSYGTGFLNANYCPMKIHENILVFSKSAACFVKNPMDAMKYNPQYRKGKPYRSKAMSTSKNYDAKAYKPFETVNDGEHYQPIDIIQFGYDIDRFHPTQKPVALLRYLVLTYTDVGGGSFGFLHRQRHDGHRLSEGASPLPRLRAEQGVFRHRTAAHPAGASAAAVGLRRRLTAPKAVPFPSAEFRTFVASQG